MIHFDFDEGTIDGYVVDSSADQLTNWLEKYDIYNESIPTRIRRQHSTIAILTDMHVDEEARGQGIGTDLIESFIGEAELQGATCIILLADTNSEQMEGFSLIHWYKKYDFNVELSNTSGALMTRPPLKA